MDKATALHKGLRVLKALRGRTLDGVSNKELVAATGIEASAISRIMATLIEEGLAERRGDGRFALSVATLQIAQQHAIEVQRAQEKINELNSRVAAGMQ